MKPTLLVLAAGMGSRYGGLKQMDPVGPSGEFVLDYSVFDAVRAGFGKVVFVIREEFETEFREKVVARYGGAVEVELVHQELDDLPEGCELPEGREKPWGTGQAIWAARDVVREPFLVVNADDFYGRAAFVAMAGWLSGGGDGGAIRSSLVAYALRNTVSENGTVSRGICEADADGALVSVVECTEIGPVAEGGFSGEDPAGARREFDGSELVSMNFWGFSPDVFPRLGAMFAEFLGGLSPERPKAEFYIPSAVTELIESGETSVAVLESDARWFGVTYREDRAGVVAELARIVAAGEYPTPLWGGSNS